MRKLQKIRIAFAGNPNSGKTTIFNDLTGKRQHVGNYAGVTVEKVEGDCTFNDQTITVVDLPGTYSLTAYSIDELVARNYIVEENPDVVINIVDASNLERNLYLTTQLLEIGCPMVIALNMSDVMKQQGLNLDRELFEKLIGVPVVCTTGNTGEGLEELMSKAIDVASKKIECKPAKIEYDKDIEQQLINIQTELESNHTELCKKYHSRWLAVKLLENDNNISKKIDASKIVNTVKTASKRIKEIDGNSSEILIAEQRYGFISGLHNETVSSSVEAHHDLSDKIDEILLHRVFGILIFGFLMYLVFKLTFTIGVYPMDWIDSLKGLIADIISSFWAKGSDSALRSLLVDGIIEGVGGVIIFLPNILILFLAISLMEDSGYLARAAFLLDRFMHRVGLHGKSFIPMLIGFGCTVPAIMATRTLESKRDRLITILITPFMSCGARLTIYMMIIPAFIPKNYQTTTLVALYLIGIALALISAILLGKYVVKGEGQPFVMELPPYRIPTLKGAWIHTWIRGGEYLKKAGTVILGISIILWFAGEYPHKKIFSKDYSQLQKKQINNFHENIDDLLSPALTNDEINQVHTLLDAKQTLIDTQTKFYKNEDGFSQAQKAYDNIIETIKNSKASEFIKLSQIITNLQIEFSEKVESAELNENSKTFIALKLAFDDKLNTLAIKHPKLYPIASQYIETTKPNHKAVLAKLSHEEASEAYQFTISGRIGQKLTPIVKPLGFDDKIATSLIGAFAAKEVFVAQMGIILSLGEVNEESTALRTKLKKLYTPLQGFCIMLFCLISTPCIATIAVTQRETNSWGWAMFQLTSLTVIAYIITLGVYQIGSLLKIGVGA